MTENEIEKLAIALLEQQGYTYIANSSDIDHLISI